MAWAICPLVAAICCRDRVARISSPPMFADTAAVNLQARAEIRTADIKDWENTISDKAPRRWRAVQLAASGGSNQLTFDSYSNFSMLCWRAAVFP